MIQRALSLIVVIGIASNIAWAQQASVDTYQAPALEVRSVTIPYLYAVMGLMLICAAVFKNAKRTHLD